VNCKYIQYLEPSLPELIGRCLSRILIAPFGIMKKPFSNIRIWKIIICGFPLLRKSSFVSNFRISGMLVKFKQYKLDIPYSVVSECRVIRCEVHWHCHGGEDYFILVCFPFLGFYITVISVCVPPFQRIYTKQCKKNGLVEDTMTTFSLFAKISENNRIGHKIVTYNIH
jgi:hypothetical protein